jgi:hypothetical protein
LSIRFQADNDLKFAIVMAVRRREPAIDFASAREAGLESVGDPELLERAARDNRVLVSLIWPMAEAIVVFWAVADPAELRDQAYPYPPSFIACSLLNRNRLAHDLFSSTTACATG